MSKKIDEMWENLTKEEREELFNKYSLYFYKKEDEEKVGFNDDALFLLSIEEYEKYEDRIPPINCRWWLRSTRCLFNYAAVVSANGVVGVTGNYVVSDDVAVRPVLRFSAPSITIGERKLFFDFPWIVIDKDLAIAEVPIAFHQFDEKSNDYGDSKIRKFLFEWIDKRLILSEGRIY